MGNWIKFCKADSLITHLLEVIAIIGISVQIETGNTPAYVYGKMKMFSAFYNINHMSWRKGSAVKG